MAVDSSADSGLTDCSGIVFRTKDEFRRAIPNRHDHFIPSKQPSLGERLVPQSGKTEITDLDDASGGDEDVGWLEISMEHEAGVEKVHAGEELVEQSAECGRGDRRSRGLGVMVDDLLHGVSAESPGPSSKRGDGGLGQDNRRQIKTGQVITLTRKSCSAYSKTM